MNVHNIEIYRYNTFTYNKNKIIYIYIYLSQLELCLHFSLNYSMYLNNIESSSNLYISVKNTTFFIVSGESGLSIRGDSASS